MNSNRISIAILGCACAAAALIALSSGCAVPSVHTMVDADFVGDRTVKYMLLDPGRTRGEAVAESISEDELPAEFHFSVRICDIGEDRREINCEDSVVLRRVGLNPDPEDHSVIDAKREVTNLFWYDTEILYVSYLERRLRESAFDEQYVWEPRVKMCAIGERNQLHCRPQEALNQMLTIVE